MVRTHLGIYAGFGFRVPFDDRLRLIRDAGFGATALWWEEKNPQIRAIRDRAPDLIRRAGLYLDNVHVPYFACRELWSANVAERREAVDLHESWIEDCARHGIPRMVMHVSLGTSTPEPSECGLESFWRLTDRGADAGVTIAIENTHEDRYIRFLMERIDSPALQLCFDTSHDQLYASVPGALLERWKHRLGALHLSDTDGRRDRHWLPGEGVVDFDGLREYWDEPYDGVFMLESVPKDRSEAPADFLARAFARLSAVVPQARAGAATSPGAPADT